MAFPAREKTFKLENCRDLYNKLEREIDRFKQEQTNPLFLSDHAFNTVVTAWHLCDWVAADLTPEQKIGLKINSRQDMQAIARQCRALHLCEQAATASKHWAVFEKYRDPNVDTILGIAPFTVDDDPHAPLKFVAFFKDGSNFIEAEKVFDDAQTFWSSFIYGNQIAANESPDDPS